MSSAWVVLGLMLGFDSLAVGAGLGTALQDRRGRLRLALLFALCDGLASFLGWLAGAAEWRASLTWCEWLGPAALGAYGLHVLCVAWHGRRLAEAGGRLIWMLPLCLSLDNLAAGMATETSAGSAVLAAFIFGAASGCLALLGLWLGVSVAGRSRLRAEWLSGAALVLVATALFCREIL